MRIKKKFLEFSIWGIFFRKTDTIFVIRTTKILRGNVFASKKFNNKKKGFSGLFPFKGAVFRVIVVRFVVSDHKNILDNILS